MPRAVFTDISGRYCLTCPQPIVTNRFMPDKLAMYIHLKSKA
jgi:hypothetical protein